MGLLNVSNLNLSNFILSYLIGQRTMLVCEGKAPQFILSFSKTFTTGQERKLSKSPDTNKHKQSLFLTKEETSLTKTC